MRPRKVLVRVSRLLSLLLAGVVVLGVAGCAQRADGWDELLGIVRAPDAKDAAGMTAAEVAKLPLREEFELAGVRYERAQELLAQTQAAIYDGEWIWLNGNFGIDGGKLDSGRQEDPSINTSYLYDLRRTVDMPGRTAVEADLDPAIKFFKSQGWKTEEYVYEDVEGDGAENDHEVVALTDDGHQITYTVLAKGYSKVQVESGSYWCNNESELMRAIIYRVPKLEDIPDTQEGYFRKPGDFTKFPAWNDPIVSAPQD